MEGRQLQFLELYRMVLADGIAHPKEMETLYRIGVENYGLTNYCCPVKVLQDKKNKAETLLQDSSLFCYFACCKKR